jgi:hypothetical protein
MGKYQDQSPVAMVCDYAAEEAKDKHGDESE